MWQAGGPAAGPQPVWRADPRDLRTSCVRFGRLLREQGLPVAPDRVSRWLRSLDLLRCDHPADLYWSARVNLVSAQPHLATFDALFHRFWLTREQPGEAAVLSPEESAPPRPWGPKPEAGGSEQGPWRVGMEYRPPGSSAPPADEPEPVSGLYSQNEALREKDFAAYRGEDEALLSQLLRERPPWLLPRNRSRRMRTGLRGSVIDLRRSVAEAVRHGGDPIRLFRRAHRVRWRKWVFLCDVSASMAPYTRGLLLFLQMVARHRPSTEVFLFGTRLTRVTPQLKRSGPNGVVLESVPDWHGGTRLGDALVQFRRQYGQRGMAHGVVLFILSDGLDAGPPGQVGAVMAQLKRMAERIVWVNPLKAREGYAPLARAMAEALPHIDEFVSGHSYIRLADLLRRQALAEP